MAHAGGAGAVLFAQPDLLLLDELTNWSDLEGAVWLEAFWPDTAMVLVISHDRGLPNRSVTGILTARYEAALPYWRL